MPQDNWFVVVAEFLYLGVIIFSFPLNIYIVNYVVESMIFSDKRHSETRKWLKNLSRTLIVATSLVVSTLFYYYLPKITGLVGVSIGTFVVMITPAILNNELVAKEPCDRALNYILITYACLATIGLTWFLILNWDDHIAH